MLDTILGRTPLVRRLQADAARALGDAGVTASQATLAAAVSGVLAAAALGLDARLTGLLLLALSAILDALDGSIARQRQTVSALGGILDLSADRLVEVVVLVAIAWRRPELHFPALLLALSWYLNITIFLSVGAALAQYGPKLILYPPGLLERTEAIIFLALLALARALGPPLCYAFGALEVGTAAQRLRFAWQKLGSGAGHPAPGAGA